MLDSGGLSRSRCCRCCPLAARRPARGGRTQPRCLTEPRLNLRSEHRAHPREPTPKPGVRASVPTAAGALERTRADDRPLAFGGHHRRTSVRRQRREESCAAQVLVLRSGHRLVHPLPHRRRGGRPRRSLRGAPRQRRRRRSRSRPADRHPPRAPPHTSSRPTTLPTCPRPAGPATRSRSSMPMTTRPRRQDLAVYRSAFGLPACTTASGCFEKLNETGDTVAAAASSPPGDDWESEISLDLDAVSAICPNCHIKLIEANSTTDSDLLAAERTAATLGRHTGLEQLGWRRRPARASDFTQQRRRVHRGRRRPRL